MIWSLEKIWSAHPGPLPLITPPSPPVGYGEWKVTFGPAGEETDALTYARRSVLAGAASMTVWLLVTTPTGEKLRWRSVAGVTPVSAHDTAHRLAAKANAIPIRFAAKAATMTPEAFFVYFKKHADLAGSTAAPVEPEKADTAAHLGRLLRELRNDLFRRKQWYLLLGDNLDASPEPARLAAHFPPPDRIRADPFVVEENGETLVFFEEMTYEEKRGYIAVGRRVGKTLNEIRPVLTADHHLSYPQVFRHAGRRWLTVESAQAGVVQAYACESWPDRWTPGPVIFPGPMIDPSVFEYAGRWWLFGNLAAGPDTKADDDLHIFFSDDPLAGRWTPHPLNPVVSDARCARGAGRPYVHNGKLHRPAQDCAGAYGRKLVLHEITTLTPESFAEKQIAILSPTVLPGAIALHTLNPGRTTVAIDAARLI